MDPSSPAAQRHHLPQPLTPFIGRQTELNDIGLRLQDPACRLLTLVGASGMGKTRLAIEAARAQAGHFPDGLCFVSLQSAPSPDFLVIAVADALRFPLSGQEATQSQLCRYLSHRAMLLVLDSFEQVLAQATWLTEWLETAPQIKLLVTSLMALNLQEEWLYPIGGLTVPAADRQPEGEAILDYSGLQLFSDRAQRVRPDFSPATEAAHIIRIGQLVEGMPLALELAAAWTKTLSCADIAAEIGRSLEILTTSWRNVPERQRSVQVIFDHAWERLPVTERHVFQRLAVFPGDFSHEAATSITGASLAILASLLYQSLLQRQPDGRYHMHGLLRQYTRMKLATMPEVLAQTEQDHAGYFVAFLMERYPGLLGGRQRAVMAEIEPELDNIRSMAEWIRQQSHVAAIQQSVLPLASFLEFRGRYLEAADSLEKSISVLRTAEKNDSTVQSLASMLVELAWMYLRFGRLDEAKELAQEAQLLDIPPPAGHATDPRLPLGVIATIRGDYETALRLGQQALQTSQTASHPWNQQFANYVLAGAALAQGDFSQAQTYAEGMLAALAKTADEWTLAYCQIMLGDIAVALGDDGAAQGHFQAGYAIRQEFEDPEGMAVALIRLGQLAWRRKAYAEAETLYQRSQKLYQDANDRGGLASALHGLGQIAAAQQRYPAALDYYHQALEIAAAMEYVPLCHALLASLGELLVHRGDAEKGVSLLALVQYHATSPQEARTQAAGCLEQARQQLAADRWQAAVEKGRSEELDDVLADLSNHWPAVSAAETAGPSPDQPHSPALVEQLTAREQEVLQLIADGLTNRQIADSLVISVGTAKYYTSQIYGKLSVSNRTQAVARARDIGLLS